MEVRDKFSIPIRSNLFIEKKNLNIIFSKTKLGGFAMSNQVKLQVKLEDKEYMRVFYKYPRSRDKALEIIKSYLPLGSPDETFDLSLSLSENYKITVMRYGNDCYYLLDFNLLDLTSTHDIILLHDNGRWLDNFVTNDMPRAIGLSIANKYFEFGYDYDVDEKYMYFWDIPTDLLPALKSEGSDSR